MDLIDRYLHAVGGFLPAADKDDIVRELGADIRAQAAEREETLGRPLSAEDEEALLRKFGHPAVLAARYRPAQHLISPVVFPFYWFALKIALGCAVAVQLGLAIAMLVSGTPGASVIGPLAAFPFTGLVTVFGWMTLAFALIDVNVRHFTARAAETWSPRALRVPTRRAWEGRASLAFEIVFSTVFLGWWLALPSHPFLVFGPAASFVAMAPAWHSLHLPLAGLWLLSLGVKWTMLFRPDLGGWRRAYDIAANAIGIVVAQFVLRADAIVTAAPGIALSAQTAGVVRVVDASFRIAAVVWLCMALWELVRAVLRRTA
jgi:hypothetical protein